MVYTKQDLNSDIPRIKRKAEDYFAGLKASGLLKDEEVQEKDYSKYTVSELKELLEEKGLSTSGLKAELVERLEEAE